MAHYGVVLVTASSKDEAQTLANALVQESLAACVNVFPVNSTYRWQGQVHHDDEWQLTIKTDLEQFEQLAARIHELHSYDLPEIIALPIVQGLPAYLSWIAEQTQPRTV